ncbi:glycosyl hydrolase [uncultured Selenomonas sp.]|uniref:glycoside hydrolase family 26 protein n=1 Tax=uncultured Selenomonas sp. TaxID=159275 RepID=UPI0025FEB92C|nr:glycosyl hydrolase [uncultured Selenomonas sp.]
MRRGKRCRFLRTALSATLATPFLFVPQFAELAARTADPAPIEDGSVELVEPILPQTRVTKQVLEGRAPNTVRLVDAQATAKTAALASFLTGVGRSQFVLYGHQNDLHHKAGMADGNPSDTHDIVHDYPAIAGLDFQALEHGDFELTSEEAAAGLTLQEKMARILKNGADKGVIFTATAHMPNFDVVAKRGRGAKGEKDWDYTGYTTPVLEGDVMNRVLPGGDLNDVYREYLDRMAAFGHRLAEDDIPLIVRLYHECDGNWFWWGAGCCSAPQYKNLYRYTVEYLRVACGVHNFLYAWSPGGPVRSAAEYAQRYPGDAFVDIVGVDMYHRDPAPDDAFLASLDKTLDVLGDFSKEHHKILAVTETGILANGHAMAEQGNVRKTWFSEVERVLERHPVAWFMTWSNDNRTDFDQPYMVSRTRGHEMVNEFVDFYNLGSSVFASQVPDYGTWHVAVRPAEAAYGYILSVHPTKEE